MLQAALDQSPERPVDLHRRGESMGTQSVEQDIGPPDRRSVLSTSSCLEVNGGGFVMGGLRLRRIDAAARA